MFYLANGAYARVLSIYVCVWYKPWYKQGWVRIGWMWMDMDERGWVWGGLSPTRPKGKSAHILGRIIS